MVGGGSLVRKDIPPYVKAAREPLSFVGVNVTGLKRRGFAQDQIHAIQDIYRLLFVRGNNITNDLYATGAFTEAGGVPANSIAKWDGGSWSALGAGIQVDSSPFEIAEGTALAMIDGALVVGGLIDFAGESQSLRVRNIATWDDMEWSAVGSGVDQRRQDRSSPVRALAATADGFYVGGNFETAGDKLSTNLAFVRSSPPLSGPGIIFADGTATVYLFAPNAGDYDIERSTTLTPAESWEVIGSVSAAAAEIISFEDDFEDIDPRPARAFYRAVQTSP